MKTVDINQLPEHVKNQVLSTLCAYDRAYVTFENGAYTYTAGLMLDTRVKAPDFTTFEILAKDVYTQEERTENYRMEFGSGPYKFYYNGKVQKWEILNRGELAGSYDNMHQAKTECAALNRLEAA